MTRLAGVFLMWVCCMAASRAIDLPVGRALEASADVVLQTDPTSNFWSAAVPIYLEKDKRGKRVVNFRTEVRMRWTRNNLYFLFICPYDHLNLKPSPVTTKETNELWNWDVAEVFIGSDFRNINHYQEFEVSPQGEWVDLDIDLNKPHHEDGWTWNSGFQTSARIDVANHRWYAAMRIPLSSFDKRLPVAGNEFRMNLFLSEGLAPNHQAVAWQPPMSDTFHVPSRFGLLKLVSR